MAEKKSTRRSFLNYAATAIVVGVVVGAGGYYAGLLGATPVEVTKTSTVTTTKAAPGGTATTTITAPPVTTTVTSPPVTKTVTTTITTSPVSELPIKVGLTASLTGWGSYYGLMCAQGVKMAAEWVNEAGGIDGRKLQFFEYDDASDPKQGSSIARKLAYEDEVVASISGTVDLPLLSMLPALQEVGIMVIGTGDNGGTMLRDEPNFRMMVADGIPQGKVPAHFFYEDLGVRGVAILQTDMEYPETMTKGFIDEFKKLGGTIAYHKITPLQNKEFRSYLTEIKSLIDQGKVDGVFACIMTDEIAFAMLQAKELGIDIKKIPWYGNQSSDVGGNSSESNITMKIAGEAAEGAYWPTPWKEEGALSKRFLEDYEAKFGGRPDGVFSALGHDAVQVLVAAIKMGGATREGIYNAVDKVKGFPILTGIGEFEGFINRGRPKPITVIQVENGSYRYVKTFTDPDITTPPPPTK